MAICVSVCQTVTGTLRLRVILKRFWSCAVTEGFVDCKTKRRRSVKKKKGNSLLTCDDSHFSLEERLAEAVTPLWRMSYEKQLQIKYEVQKKTLQFLDAHLIQKKCLQQPNSQNQQQLSFPLLPTMPSPVLEGYRNKSTFSVNKGPDGNPKTVGFYIGTGKGQNIVCVHADHLLNLPEKHKQVATYYEQFIQQSPLESCILFHKGGHWREITVRTSSLGDTMAIVYFHPQNLKQDEIQPHKESLVNFFTRGAGAACQLTSLYFQESSMTRSTNEQAPYQLLYGKPHIYEEIQELKFRISPDAFFQVNTFGAEALFKTVRDASQSDKSSTLLDVCCGTGAIGLSLSKDFKNIIGIELIEQAIEDAKYNASLNGILNCHFLAGKAEVILPQLLLPLYPSVPHVAVVNPSRAGLHYRVIRAIRNCTSIRKLVYISCKPDGEAMKNFIELCGPPDPKKKLFGNSFVPTLAIPIDMFPHTLHCELIIIFER
ncbi:tRNA (uracil-5-)-methyltransferase homolog B [Erpetoichthys calabaricus]|uniref:tRNA (uracil-5-)-methyltransferase homolog B n=1 Tax=Erpetoichthys calabaricus TaxID=27687 RepID=UPI0010A01FC5|nr:tRNA (uracil-5-)-methyltransferase homolog B [Erpetoichthys calabaricus]